MSDKRSILIQLDTDEHPSVFDRVVAVDSGVDQLFSYGGVKPEQAQALTHGAIFTRSPKSLHRTAVFVGGSDVTAAEKVLEKVKRAMIREAGLQVSVMLDPNGANTTAASAVCAAAKHMDLNHAHALILGGTGPVGQRVARLLAKRDANVRIGSRSLERAEAVCGAIRTRVPGAKLEAVATASSGDGPAALEGRDLVIAAGAAGALLLPKKIRTGCDSLRVAIDLNAVPPAGIEGIEVMAQGAERDGVISYGAIGVGDGKMRIHRAAIAKLFESNDQVLDAEEIYDLALSLDV